MTLNIHLNKSIVLIPKQYLLASVCNYGVNTENLRVIEKPTLEGARRGTGFRSSFNGITATVFGALGCVGRPLVSTLANRGTQCIIPYRCYPDRLMPLKCMGDLGQILFTPFDLEDEDSLRRSMKYSDVVINCLGKDTESFRFKYKDVHVEGPRRIARIAREMGVKKLIHFSAMGASPSPPQLHVKGGSRWMKSKWEGELAVREEFPNAIIVRPSEIYGEFDNYFRYYAQRALLYSRKIYLYKKGLETIKMPIYNVDVAEGVYQLVVRHKNDVEGKTYQFVGPRSYLHYDLVRYIYKLRHIDETYGFSIEDSRFFLFFPFIKWYYDNVFVRHPWILAGAERWERENTTDVIHPNLSLITDLGVKLTDIELIAPHFMESYSIVRMQRYKEVYEYKKPQLRIVDQIFDPIR